MAIRILATTRLTEARTRSNASVSSNSSPLFSALKRLFTNFDRPGGVIFDTPWLNSTDLRTINLASEEEAKRSDPSSWRLRSMVVAVTALDFFENLRVNTIISPAEIRKKIGVLTGFCRDCIRNPLASDAPEAV